METFQFEGKTFRSVPETAGCRGCAFQYLACETSSKAGRPDCASTRVIFVEVQQPAEPQQPAASGLTRLVPLREKTVHTLEETTSSDPQVSCWGVSLDGVPMIRLDTLTGAQQVQRLADAAFQAGRQKAFSDLLGFVEGQR